MVALLCPESELGQNSASLHFADIKRTRTVGNSLIDIVNDAAIPASAVIGALLGGYFLLRLQRNQRRDEMYAAARAVLREMPSNVRGAAFAEGLVLLPIPFDAHDRFSRITWSEQLPLVARLLNWRALLKVRGAYDSGSTVFRLAASGIKSSADQANARQMTTELKELFIGVAKEFEEGLKLFPLGRLLNSEERADFDSELRKWRESHCSKKPIIFPIILESAKFSSEKP